MSRPVVEFELVDHGITAPDYFQGCGTAFTEFEGVFTGIGMNPLEAIEDALELLAQSDWSADGMEARLLDDLGLESFPTVPEVPATSDDLYYHVSIRVR